MHFSWIFYSSEFSLSQIYVIVIFIIVINVYKCLVLFQCIRYCVIEWLLALYCSTKGKTLSPPNSCPNSKCHCPLFTICFGTVLRKHPSLLVYIHLEIHVLYTTSLWAFCYALTKPIYKGFLHEFL